MVAANPPYLGRDAPLFEPSASELDLYQKNVEDMLLESRGLQHQKESQGGALLHDLLDISSTLNEAGSAIVDDSFTKCFRSNDSEPWNWNIYLFPLWCLGVVVRYVILFPLRLILLIAGWIVFIILFTPVHFTFKGKLRRSIERFLVEMMCGVFVASWTGVIKYHGPRPSRGTKTVWVANHTSMIDFIILEQVTAFAVIMQKHPGWVGLIQSSVLDSVGCIWFNRMEANDRVVVGQKIRKHVDDPESNPLLIFPEGCCVNNEYVIMFKKGAFDLGCTVCPIAIKYNKIFVDAFWNSRRQSFSMHLFRLMTSWAVVCDVWFLEPQTIQPGETSIEFADRVRAMIAKRAGMHVAPWDGYLKYYRPSPKLKEKQQAKYADEIAQRLDQHKET
eukprot:TRINITY_DN56_c0_g1_i2.p1 TRINITY_DN56_c0_g1~~TRINITY_DN56_c0_g1_i2.p1  ORF type:complete len:389 (+),score=73.71 TRINITY_DN56_c0_g1_i2:172-1338(+)